MEIRYIGSGILKILGKYKFVLLIIAVGIVLMLLPGNTAVDEKKIEYNEMIENTPDIAEQLSQMLSSVDGAGKTKVLLTVLEGERTVFQTDEDSTVSDNNSDVRKKTVIVSNDSRKESGLVQQINPPVYLGAVVLCQGADKPQIRLAIVDAVSKATGLGANQISVLKMQ